MVMSWQSARAWVMNPDPRTSGAVHRREGGGEKDSESSGIDVATLDGDIGRADEDATRLDVDGRRWR